MSTHIKFGSLKGLIIGVLGLLLYWLHPALLDELDLKTQDIIHAKRPMPMPDSRVAVVKIDEKSIAMLGRWPWSRTLQAKLLQVLKDANPAVISLDIIYSNYQSAEADEELATAIRAKGSKTIGGYFFRNKKFSNPPTVVLDTLKKNQIMAVFDTQEITLPPISIFPSIEANVASIQRAFDALGFFNYIPDPDGLLRRIPLVLSFEDRYYPSLALKSLSLFFNVPIILETNQGDINKVKLGKNLIPTDRLGKMVLGFYDKHRPISAYSALDVLQGKHNQDLKNKLIFVGVTEIGVADVRPTPVDESFPGVMAHAVTASNIIQKHYSIKNKKTILFDVFAMLLLPILLISLLSLSKGLARSLLMSFALAAAFGAIYYWLLAYKGWLVSVIYPMLLLTITFIIYEIWFNLVSQKETQFIKTVFSSYVAPSVVDKIVENKENLVLGGEEQELSILFSDIRNFSSISEYLKPSQLVSILNIYMDMMTHIVTRHQGTLDKYIGDAMMVLYNAPVKVENHAMQAALSAVKMKQILPEINKNIAKLADVQLKIGVGIHTGKAVVGNMGSDIRFSYTAIGDNVNLASRLETATKMYGVSILISEKTYQKIKTVFYCKEIDRLQVKGKKKWVTVYELLDIKQTTNTHYQEKIDHYASCMQHYYAQDFKQAITQLKIYLSANEGDGPATNLLNRCELYLQHPPAKDWGGVYVSS